MTTACIQIGNSDNKLSQQEWSKYCSAIRGICEAHGQVHFAGGPATDAPYQNYCIVVETEEAGKMMSALSMRRAAYQQESIAWFEGGTVFI